MTVSGVLLLAGCMLACIGAFIAGYAKGEDAGQDQVLDFIKDEIPEAWAVMAHEIGATHDRLQQKYDDAKERARHG